MRKIKTNDNVIVTKGKDAGKTGKVQKIIPDKGMLLIEGINTVSYTHQTLPTILRV